MAPAELRRLADIETLADLGVHLGDEDRCHRLMEAIVWPHGRVCPLCGCPRSTELAARDGRQPVYQCANLACRRQFTVTAHTPFHATKLPLKTWLTALWLILRSDRMISSSRMVEVLGISQPTARRMGYVLRAYLDELNQRGISAERRTAG